METEWKKAKPRLDAPAVAKSWSRSCKIPPIRPVHRPMRTKVDVRHVKLGMRVCELDRPWEETPYVMPGFALRTPADLEELARYCEYVFVDNDDEEEDKAAAAEFALLRTAACPHTEVRLPTATLVDELPRACRAYHGATEAIDQAAREARLGQRVELAPLRGAVQTLALSVQRHPDALLLVARLARPMNGAVYRAILALLLADRLDFTAPERQDVGLGALLADLGLQTLSERLLHRPGPLTHDERLALRRHVGQGLLLLENSQLPPIAREVIACHHERLDGRGYPRGLRGNAIGRYGLLGGLVDHFAAVTSDRAHRAADSPFVALQGLYLLRGKSFCPTLIDELIHAHGIYGAGTWVDLGQARVGLVIERNPGRPLKPRVALPNPAGPPDVAYVDLAREARDDHGRPWEIVRAPPSGPPAPRVVAHLLGDEAGRFNTERAAVG